MKMGFLFTLIGLFVFLFAGAKSEDSSAKTAINGSLILSKLQLQPQMQNHPSFEKQLQEIHEEMNKQGQQIHEQQQKMHEQEHSLHELEQKLLEMKSAQEKPATLKDIGKTLRSSAGAANAVAFTATNETADNLQPPFVLDAGTTMLFQTVSLAEGSGYDPATSIFTCPVTGIYYFAASVTGGNYQERFGDGYVGYDTFYFEEVHLAITKDDVNQVGAEVWDFFLVNGYFSSTRFDGTTASASVVVNCAAGSRVQVKADKLSYITCPPPLSCSFTGYLVEQLA